MQNIGKQPNYTPNWYAPRVTQPRTGSLNPTGTTQPTANPAAPASPAAPGPYVAQTPLTTANAEFNAGNWQNMVNLARRSTAGQNLAGAESLRRDLSGAGFKVGESGIAGSTLGNYWNAANEKLGQTVSGMAAEQAKNQFLQNFNLDQLNFEKSKWGQEFGASREDQATTDMLNYLNLMNQNQMAPYAAYWGGMTGAINS